MKNDFLLDNCQSSVTKKLQLCFSRMSRHFKKGIRRAAITASFSRSCTRLNTFERWQFSNIILRAWFKVLISRFKISLHFNKPISILKSQDQSCSFFVIIIQVFSLSNKINNVCLCASLLIVTFDIKLFYIKSALWAI